MTNASELLDTHERVLKFLGAAFRNIDLPPLSEDDLDDIGRELARKVIDLEAQLAEMREALGKVQSYHKGEKPYDFHRLPDDQRQNEAFDAWQVIACEIDALLTKEPK